MKKVSIIIPVYNAELYLKRCIDSLLDFKDKIYELILINDGSTDNSAKICQQYSEEYKMIYFFNQENKGPSAARNLGISKSNGDYIMFIDSDDYINENFKYIFSNLENNNADYYIYELTRDNKVKIKDNKIKESIIDIKNSKKILKKMIISEKINSPVAKLYKKNIIDKYNIKFNEKYKLAEDLLFNLEYLYHCQNFLISNLPIYIYFKNTTSITQKYNKEKYNDLMNINEEIKPLLVKLDVPEIYHFLITKNIFSCIYDLNKDGCKFTAKEKIEFIKNIKDNYSGKILINCGLKMFIWSFIYTFSSAKIIFLFIKIKYML